MVISCLILGKYLILKYTTINATIRSILGKNYNWTHQMVSIKVMLRYYLYQLLPFKNCRHWADFIILEMLWWRFWKRQSGEFCISCNWIPCFRIGYRNAAITEHGSLSRDAMFCSSHIVHPHRRNQPWFQAYTSVCPRGARREKTCCCNIGHTIFLGSMGGCRICTVKKLRCVENRDGSGWTALWKSLRSCRRGSLAGIPEPK